MAFPTSPTNGQIAVQNGITYTYASATNSWTRNPATLPSLSVYIDTFAGDGTSTSFTLSNTPSGKDYVSINIDGVSQLKSAYNLSTNIITFTGTPDDGSVIEVKSWNAASVGVLTGLTFDSFTGDGSDTTYTLSTSPTNKNYTLVTVGGITQEKVNYGVSGTTLTFTTAPPNNAPIEVMTFGPAINSAASGGSNTQVQYNNNGTLSGSSFLTFNNSTNTLTTGNLSVSDNITATTANLTNINISNTSSQVPNAIVASTVFTAAQPNITSVGTLANLTVQGWATLFQTTEGCELKNGATGTVTHDMSTAGTFYHATIAANFTANFTNVPTTNNRITVASLILSQGGTAYMPTVIQIAGAVQTVKWLMNASPTGTASKFDVISYTFTRIADSWLVFGQYSTYG